MSKLISDKFARLATILGVCVLTSVVIYEAKSMEHMVGNKSVNEVFVDPKLSSLAQSACEGDAAAVARGVREGADANGKGFDDVTPLYWSVSCQNVAGTTALLLAGAKPNYMFGGRFSAVYAASTMKDSRILKILLKNGGDPNARDNSENISALERALSLGIHGENWENYYALLDAGANINQSDAMGDTIAHAAAAFGRFDKVNELLDRGYTNDLTGLGRTLQARFIPEANEMAKWKEKVKLRLEQNGVHFPIPPKPR